MNEKINITLFFVNLFVAILLCIGLCFQIKSLRHSRELVEQYRDREQQYAETVESLTNRINEYNARIETEKTISGTIGDSLQRQLTTVRQLREVLSEIRKNYEEMENCLYGNIGVFSNISSNSGEMN